MKTLVTLALTFILSVSLYAEPLRVAGYVLSKTPEGVLVVCKNDPRAIGVKRAKGTIFLKGHPQHAALVDRAAINCLATVSGIHEYTTVMKAHASVQEFTFEK